VVTVASRSHRDPVLAPALLLFKTHASSKRPTSVAKVVGVAHKTEGFVRGVRPTVSLNRPPTVVQTLSFALAKPIPPTRYNVVLGSELSVV
jgi:hypothetical protein